MRKLMVSLVLVFALVVMGMAGDDCPKVNKINSMESTMQSFKDVSPLDFSTIKSAGAMSKKQGTRLEVYLSNGTFTTKQMSSSFVVPIKKKDEFIAVIHFSNGKEKIVPGTYNGSSGYGKPFWAYAEVKLFKGEKGTIVSLGIREGTAVITKLTDNMVCGTFDLKSKTGSKSKGAISGTFNVKLEKSKW